MQPLKDQDKAQSGLLWLIGLSVVAKQNEVAHPFSNL